MSSRAATPEDIAYMAERRFAYVRSHETHTGGKPEFFEVVTPHEAWEQNRVIMRAWNVTWVAQGKTGKLADVSFEDPVSCYIDAQINGWPENS